MANAWISLDRGELSIWMIRCIEVSLVAGLLNCWHDSRFFESQYLSGKLTSGFPGNHRNIAIVKLHLEGSSCFN